MSIPESQFHGVPLREHFESLLKHERELRVTEQESAKQALDLQAAEYERRLDALNHEHARTRETQQTYVPFTRFEDFVKEDKRWKDRISEEISLERGRREAQAMNTQRLIAFVGLILSALSVALRYLP